uniref:RING-type domain-containing protein n=1 Tax=Neogobius melanostomus TaxID=47308 RepID=A0A8C6WG75_9GOBI
MPSLLLLAGSWRKTAATLGTPSDRGAARAAGRGRGGVPRAAGRVGPVVSVGSGGRSGEGEDGAPPGVNNNNNNHHQQQQQYEPPEGNAKARGCNITECVPVPSSEHVAEIVGRQGCKIKALRAKTNTYIKTPVRGEEPVFLITGRKEDVALARREIISAAEHFSMLRASRNKLGLSFSGSPPAPLPGQTTIQVRVPYRVVGLVVGPKGSTIKRIQQQTCTYIVTPSRDRDPVFEITGSPSNAERAREEIEAHIAFRTGGLHEHNNENDCLGSSGPPSGGGALESRLQQVWGVSQRKPLSSYRQNFPEPQGGGDSGGVFKDKPSSYFDPDQSWDSDFKQAFYTQQRSKSFAGLALLAPATGPAHARRAHSEPSGGEGFPGRLPLPDSPPAGVRDCMTCYESKVTAALVPCGHNLFCMECAIRICELKTPECPMCHSTVTQAIRIFS